MLAQPLHISGLVDHVFDQRKHSGDHFGLLRLHAAAVAEEKHRPGHKGDPVVAVRKPMVLAEASGSIGGRQIEQIRLTVGEQGPGPVHRRFDGALVSQD